MKSEYISLDNLEEEQKENTVEWWKEKNVFFGSFYLDAANVNQEQNFKERTCVESEGIISLLKLKSGMKLLDCPCGHGRHSNYLAEKGIDVVGGDINNYFLNEANEQAKKMKLNTSFQRMNMLDINYTNEFDAIINILFSFACFLKDEENF